MSDPTGPVRRRRIAGETKPAAPATKPKAPKVPARKAAAKKAAMQKSAPPVAPPGKTVATPKAARPPKTAVASAPREPSESSGLDPRWLIPRALVAVVAIVAGVVLMVLGVQNVTGPADGNDDLDAAREQAVSAAGSAAKTIFTFSADKLPEHESASKALMTPSFAKDFEKVAPALGEVTADRKVVVEAVVRDAAPLACGEECSPTKVNVLVFFDQARLVGSSKEPTVFARRISVSMVKTDEGWLVNDIRAL